MTDKEIDINDVPLTPGGKNHDFNAVRNYDFVRYSEVVSFKTKFLCDSENNESCISDNEIDLSTLKTDDEKVEAIIKSPMVEVRKKSKLSSQSFTSEGEIRLNPNRSDLMETSTGCYNNYTKGRRYTIGVIKNNESGGKNLRSRRNSLPSSSIAQDNKENISLDRELELLVNAVDDSRTLLEVEKKRLSDMISDWSHILEMESKDIPIEIQGDIKSAIGLLQILMDKRYQSTVELLQLAEIYINNDGVKVNEDDREYRAGDIYGFVDILIDEIKKVDEEFNKLLSVRNNNWVETTLPEPVVKSKNRVKKAIPTHLKNVKSRLDVALIKRNRSKIIGEQESISSNSGKHETMEHHDKKTPVSKIKPGVRLKSVLKSVTGTPVHKDTPRPRKSVKVNVDHKFAIPGKINMPLRNRKRSFANSTISNNNESPVNIPKTARTRKSTRKSKD